MYLLAQSGCGKEVEVVQGKRLSELQVGEQAMIVSFTELDEKHVRKLLALKKLPPTTDQR
jgi:hypothetical protein